MSRRTGSAQNRRAMLIAGLILLQALCAIFFVGDVIEDVRGDGHLDTPHMMLETLAAVGLIAGVIFLMIELRRMTRRLQHMSTGLQIARGHLTQVMEDFFDDWKLTTAERDVALMILKGLDNDQIADLRQTAVGTVRAQTTRVYAKSGTHSRAEFISLFMEELMAGDVLLPPAIPN